MLETKERPNEWNARNERGREKKKTGNKMMTAKEPGWIEREKTEWSIFFSFFFLLNEKYLSREKLEDRGNLQLLWNLETRKFHPFHRLYLEGKRAIKYRSDKDVAGPWSIINRINIGSDKISKYRTGTRKHCYLSAIQCHTWKRCWNFQVMQQRLRGLKAAAASTY